MGVKWQLAALIASIATTSLLGGCTVTVTNNTANAYEQCNAGQACEGTTSCQEANATTDGFTGDFCTSVCNVNSPTCPDPGGTGLVVCVPDNGSTTGLCYQGCLTNLDCPGSEQCSDAGNGVLFCVP